MRRSTWLVAFIGCLAWGAAWACSCQKKGPEPPPLLTAPKDGARGLPCQPHLFAQTLYQINALDPAGAERRSLVKLVSAAGEVVPIEQVEAQELGRYRTQIFKPSSPLAPKASYTLEVTLVGMYREPSQRAIRFETGACKGEPRPPARPARISGVKIQPPRYPGPSCGTGNSAARFKLRGRMKRGVAAYAIYEVDAQKERRLVAYTLAGHREVVLGRASTCAPAADGPAPKGGARVYFTAQAVSYNGLRSKRRDSGGWVKVPEEKRRHRH